MRQKTGSSPLQLFMATGSVRPAMRIALTVFCERAPSWSRRIVRDGSTDSLSWSENTRPPAGRLDCATRLAMGSGMQSLAFGVEEGLRDDRRLAGPAEVVDGDAFAEARPPAAQQRERDRLAERRRLAGGGHPAIAAFRRAGEPEVRAGHEHGGVRRREADELAAVRALVVAARERALA